MVGTDDNKHSLYLKESAKTKTCDESCMSLDVACLLQQGRGTLRRISDTA